jgi:type IV secretory pathway VirB2 component (pilin)
MSKVFKYAIAYGMWFVDLGLSAWLFFVSRTALLTFLALSYEERDFRYTKTAQLIDQVFTILLGLGWLALFVLTEGYYRAGALQENLQKRFARVTGPILMCIFLVDLILFGLQGFGGGDWLRWLVLSAELVIGLMLILYARKTAASKPA